MKEQHMHDCFVMPRCCSNIKKKPLGQLMIKDPHSLGPFKGDKISQDASDTGGLPPHKQFNRINSFTLTGNSSLHFELSRDPSELIGAIFWQLKRIKIEKYDPIVIHGHQQSN